MKHICHIYLFVAATWSLPLVALSQTPEPVTVGFPRGGHTDVAALTTDRNLRFGAFVANPSSFGFETTASLALLFADIQTNQVQFVQAGVAPGQGEAHPTVSLDGRFLVYTRSTGARQVMLFDRIAGTSQLVSTTASGDVLNGNSDQPSISGDGRFIVFRTTATNFLASDTDSLSDIVLIDRIAGTREHISLGSLSTGSKGSSSSPSISEDGRFVSFVSFSSNLVPSDGSGSDAFLWDRSTNSFSKLSVSATGGDMGGSVRATRLSPDAQFASFVARGNNIAVGAPSNAEALYVREIATGTTRWTGMNPVTPGGLRTSPNSTYLIVENSGTTGTTRPAGTYSYRFSDGAVIPINLGTNVVGSENLSRLLFVSGNALSSDDLNGRPDFYERSGEGGVFTRRLIKDVKRMMDADTVFFTVSNDGSRIAWSNRATNIDLFSQNSSQFFTGFRDMSAPLSRAFDLRDGAFSPPANAPWRPRVSFDGNWIVSEVNNLISLRNLQTQQVTPISVDFASGFPIHLANEPMISGDGRYITFFSTSPRITPGLIGSTPRLFLHDRQTNSTIRIDSDVLPALYSSGDGHAYRMDLNSTIVDYYSRPSQDVKYCRYHVSDGTTQLIDNDEFIYPRLPTFGYRGLTQPFEANSPFQNVNIENIRESLFSAPLELRCPSPDFRMWAGLAVSSFGTLSDVFVFDALTGRKQVFPGTSAGFSDLMVFSRDRRYVFFQSREQVTDHTVSNIALNVYRLPLEPRATGPMFSIVLEHYRGPMHQNPVVVEVIQNNVVVEKLLPGVFTGNQFMVAPRSFGQAILRVKYRTGLKRAIPVNLGPNLAPQTITLTNGDINDDNEIGAVDFSLLAQWYDRDGFGVYAERSDLDGDGEVGANDFSILAAGYDQVGD